jgi:hypothetical protein
MTITICSSTSFYKHVIEIKKQLEKQGHTVLVPRIALMMEKSNDYDVSHYKTWFADANDYHKKAEFMHGHFDEVTKGDAILVVNDEKHGVANYVGGNVLMEMALAFHLGKKIYIFGDLPTDSSFEEELKGMEPTILKGDIGLL